MGTEGSLEKEACTGLGGREHANNKAAGIHTGAGQSGAAAGVEVKPALGSCQLTSLLDNQTSHPPVLVSCSIQ